MVFCTRIQTDQVGKRFTSLISIQSSSVAAGEDAFVSLHRTIILPRQKHPLRLEGYNIGSLLTTFPFSQKFLAWLLLEFTALENIFD